MSYDSVTLTAYLPSGDQRLIRPFHILPLPKDLRSAFSRFHYSRFADPDKQRPQSFPIRRLNSVLAATAPDVISIGGRVAVEDEAPWLYAHAPVDLRLIRGVLKLWLRDMKSVGSADAVDPAQMFDLVDSVPLTWREQDVDLQEQVPGPRPTAEPVPHLYRLLPDFLARVIRSAGPFTPPNGPRRSFVQSPGSSQRAELVSWPPTTAESGARFSYVITISVHTIPFTQQFRVHVRTSVRRWITKPGPGGTLYTGRRSVSVHLLTASPWEGVSGERSRLTVNRLRYQSSRGAHAWRITDGPDLPSGASVLPRLPDARELVGAPGQWLAGVDGVVAAIPYNTGMGSHDVGAGLMAGDRVPLMAWIDDALLPFLERAPQCRQLSLPNHPSNFPVRRSLPSKMSKEERDRINAEKARERARQEALERRESLRELLNGAPFVARVHWQERDTRDALVLALRELLDLPPLETSHDVLTWKLPGVEICLQLCPSGVLTSSLDISAGPKTSRRDLQEAISRRRSLAENSMLKGSKASAGLPLVALVEIDVEFKDSRSDPKFAIRLGCAQAGSVTQFIQTAVAKRLKKNRAHRARASWLDAFRQLGVTRVPRHTFTDSLPADLQYVSVWMAKRRWDGPTRTPAWRLLALRVRPEDGIRAVQGWRTDIRRWVTYREYQLWLASKVESAEAAADQYGESEEEPQSEEVCTSDGQIAGTREERRRRTNELLRPLIAQLKERPTVLMAHAQNLRDGWTWLRNGDVERDRIWLDDGESPVPISVWGRGLRLIRTRDSGGDETPQWYGTDGKNGLPAGLRPVIEAPDQRVFYSSTDRPPTARNASVEATREGRRRNRMGSWVSDTDKDASNPNLLEIAVLACQSADEPDAPQEWAACAHQMRYAPDLQAPLALPYPLHMAKRAADYVLPTSDE
ncbi:pPIWI_RE module domain-containing protein [Nocardiopsis mangrovi]|uniref:PPIWI_RE module domain-containing protein n=1 Tax=Nocardiopsis mangrovi TaxID=1179818 RepID=A0ABV9E083_9ACTN